MMKIMTSTVEIPPSLKMAGAAAVGAGKPEQGLVRTLTRLYGCSVPETQHSNPGSYAHETTGSRPTASLVSRDDTTLRRHSRGDRFSKARAVSDDELFPEGVPAGDTVV